MPVPMHEQTACETTVCLMYGYSIVDRECHYLLSREQEMLTELRTLLEVNVPGSKQETTDSLILSSHAEVGVLNENKLSNAHIFVLME